MRRAVRGHLAGKEDEKGPNKPEYGFIQHQNPYFYRVQPTVCAVQYTESFLATSSNDELEPAEAPTRLLPSPLAVRCCNWL
jgi:hypothetical protein